MLRAYLGERKSGIIYVRGYFAVVEVHRQRCKTLTVANSSDAETVLSVENSHSWKVRWHEEYGNGIGGVMVTLDCQRCGIEEGILMIQGRKAPEKKLVER